MHFLNQCLAPFSRPYQRIISSNCVKYNITKSHFVVNTDPRFFFFVLFFAEHNIERLLKSLFSEDKRASHACIEGEETRGHCGEQDTQARYNNEREPGKIRSFLSPSCYRRKGCKQRVLEKINVTRDALKCKHDLITSPVCMQVICMWCVFCAVQEEGPQVKRSSSPPRGAPKKRTAFIDITNVSILLWGCVDEKAKKTF